MFELPAVSSILTLWLYIKFIVASAELARLTQVHGWSLKPT